ncbi:MAG: hypothetical protein WEB58_00210 [Planctomycetaceae bacterium]
MSRAEFDDRADATHGEVTSEDVFETAYDEAMSFARHASAKSEGRTHLVFGVILLAGAAIGFACAIRFNVGQFSMHLMTTLPMLLAIGLIWKGRLASSNPLRVDIDSAGITLVTATDSVRHLWSDVGMATVTDVLYTKNRRLALFDPQAKKLAVIGDAITDFQLLTELVQHYVAQTQPDTSEQLRLKKARRMALLTGAAGLFLGFAGVSLFWKAQNDERGRNLLVERGVVGEGKILRHFTAPNGVTRRVEYEVTGDNGQTATHNVEVETLEWELLEHAPTVPIKYVPAEPEFAQLLAGEVRDSTDLGTREGWLMLILGGAMSLFMLGVSAMQWTGWDYGTDPNTGQLGWRRIGT